MSAGYLEDILKTLGWEDGFQIPVANYENQNLEKELAELTLKRVKLKNCLDNETQRVEYIENHLKYIEQEYDENQKLITSYNQECQGEQNILHTLEAEKSKLKNETTQTIKTINDVEKRKEFIKNKLQKGVRKLDKLKAETNWDNEAIKAWNETLEKREQDNEAIKRFSKEDEHKYNELEAKRKNLEVEAIKRRGIMVKLVSDLKNYELVLERTGKVIKQQEEEKNSLIKQWQQSVKILHERDNEIDCLEKEVLSLQESLQLQQELLNEQNKFHENLIQTNNNSEIELSELNTIHSKLRSQFNELTQAVLLVASECNAYKTILNSSLNRLEKERREKVYLTEQIIDKESKIIKYSESFEPLVEKVKELRQSALTVVERTQQIQQIIEKEKFRLKFLINEITVLQKTILKSQEELQKEIHLSKTQKYDISSLISTVNRLKRFNRDIQTEVDREKETVYNVNFKIDEIKGKIHKIEFPFIKGDPNSVVLETKIRHLEDKLNNLMETKALIQEQINKILNDNKDISAQLVEDESLINKLNDKLLNQRLNFEGGQKELAAAKSILQERQVEENLLRLKASHFEKATKKQQNNIYNLQKFRLSLEEAMMERIVQINTNKDILLAKRRNLGEDRSRIKADLTLREIRVDQFRKKYEMILDTLGKDEDGQPLSITHFKIKKAQEKFFLQQEGDELDCKIKRAEKEIVAMENTLKMVNLTNNKFKKSLTAVEDEGEEIREKEKLETEIDNLNLILRQLRKDLAIKKEEFEKSQSLLEETEELTKEKENTIKNLKETLGEIEEKINKKEEQLNRAKTNIKKLKEKLMAKNLKKYERDLDICLLRDANKSVRQRLMETSVIFQETSPLIFRYSNEYNIKLDQLFSSTSSSSTSIISATTTSRTGCSSSTSNSSNRSKNSSIFDKPSSSKSTSINTVNLSLNL